MIDRIPYLKIAFLLFLLAAGSASPLFAQCDTSRWKGEISPGGIPVVLDTLTAQEIFQGGVLQAPPQPGYPNPYFASFYLRDTFCITNNFSFEVRLKNDPANGGAASGDTWLNITGSGINAGCLLEGNPGGQIYTIISAGSNYVTNIPQLVMNLSTWRIVRLDFIDNVVHFSTDGSNFFSLPYTGNICNITALNFGFREAGEVDWVKIYDAYNNVIYNEEFDDCNNLATGPDCMPPIITASSNSTSYCTHDLIQLQGNTNVPIQYTWTGPNGFTSSLPNPAISDASVSDEGWYKLTGIVNACSPTSVDSVYVTVHPVKTTTLYPSICQGDFYNAGGANQTTAGTYFDTLATTFGCDSVLITNLSILPTSATSLSTSICQNDSLFVGGSFQKLAGTYYDTLQNFLGCDSVIATSLSLILPVYYNQNLYICLGDSIFLGGSYQQFSGTYHDTLTSLVTACDSVIITDLQVYVPVYTYLSASICQGDSFFVGGANQSSAGAYNDTLQTITGCDSVLITNLQIIPTTYGNQTISICQGDSFLVGGAFQTLAGFYVDTIQSVAGCDSVLTTDLQLIPPSYGNASTFICLGDSIFLGGAFQDQPGMYVDTIQTVAGCDSILTTDLQVINPVYTNLAVTICQGDSFFVGGGYQTVAGVYNDTLQSILACDSILITSLQLTAPVYFTMNVSICLGDSYFAGGANQTTTGTYVDKLQSAAGCDSILTTNLQVLFPVLTSSNVSICDGQSYYAGGALQTLPGSYSDTLVAASGCDSIQVTQLTVLPNPMVYLGADTSICEGTILSLDPGAGFSSYLWNNQSHAQTIEATGVGSYSVVVTDINGCTAGDTLEIVDLWDNPSQFLPDDSAVCGKFSRIITVPGYETYLWSTSNTDSSVEFTTEGVYVLEVKDANGCVGTDSIVFEAICEESILMPNAFTPNGDGLNDIFRPVMLDDVTDFELKIFNRWGKVVFYSSNPDDGWDGNEKNLAVGIEEYVWTVRYRNQAGEERIMKGSVTLLK